MTAQIITFPRGKQATSIKLKLRFHAIHEAARAGLFQLSENEKALIRLLRRTSFPGREDLLIAAHAIQKTHPLVCMQPVPH